MSKIVYDLSVGAQSTLLTIRVSLEGLNALKGKLFVVTLLAVFTLQALSYPWERQGFSAVYSYDMKTYGLLAMKVKGASGTVKFTFINVTGNFIYYKVYTNITMIFNAKVKKHINNTMILKVPLNMSTVFITNSSLAMFKKTGQLTCKGSICTYQASKTIKLKNGMVLLTHVKEVIDIEKMIAKEIVTKTLIKTSKGLKLGGSITVLKLVKTSP